MRVLWSVNLIPGDMSRKLNITSEVLGGWVEAMAAKLKGFENVELAVACKCDAGISFCETVNGVKYYSLSYSSSNARCAALTARSTRA